MKALLFRVGSFSVVGVVAGSFLPALLPGSALLPAVFFSLAVAIALSRGFLAGLPTVVALGLFLDVATLGRIGLLSGFAVGVAYTASFFSRRFAVEHVALTAVFSGLLSGVAAIVFPVFSDALLGGVSGLSDRWTGLLSIGPILRSVSVGIVAFVLATILVHRYDDALIRLDPGSLLRLRK